MAPLRSRPLHNLGSLDSPQAIGDPTSSLPSTATGVNSSLNVEWVPPKRRHSMRSLKREKVYQVGDYLITQRRTGFSLSGCANGSLGRKFTLEPMKPGKWRLTGRSSTGSRSRIRFEAVGLEAAISEAESLLYPQVVSPQESELKVSECLARWFNTLSISSDTETVYRYNVHAFLDWAQHQGFVSWGDFRLDHLLLYAKELCDAGKSRRYIELRCAPVIRAARWAAHNWPEKYRDFSAGFRIPEPNRELSYEDQLERGCLRINEVGSFLVRCQNQEQWATLAPGIALQGLCGLRLREAWRLRWNRVDLAKGIVTVDGVVKNLSSVRRLPLPSLVLTILNAVPPSGDRVLAAYADQTAYAKAVGRCLRQVFPGRRIEPKGLRRTLPTQAIREGWGGYALERYLGHSPKSVTDKHYVAPTGDEVLDLFRTQVVARIEYSLQNLG